MQLIYGFNPKQQIVTSFYVYIFMTLRTKLIEKSEMYPVFFCNKWHEKSEHNQTDLNRCAQPNSLFIPLLLSIKVEDFR